MGKKRRATGYAVLAAALYALSTPLSKLLMGQIPATMLAGFLYLGAGLGMWLLGRWGKGEKEQPLTARELPYTVAMVVLDIAAPILLLVGLGQCSAAHVSLLNNFEIVATSLLAWLIFHERITPRLWLGIGLVTLASVLLSLEPGGGGWEFSPGSLLVLGACLCWGLENNCTRMMSAKNPMQIVTIKGFGSGLGALVVALVIGERFFQLSYILLALVLGFVAYGLSIYFYVYAQRELGAARTSAFYALAPFIGAALSLVLCGVVPAPLFWVALAVMLLGSYFSL